MHNIRGEKIHFSIYQSAAHSMAAVGMLAPLMESIFHQAFFGIKNEFFLHNKYPTDHLRWTKAEVDVWDCHFVWEKNNRRKDLVKGIIQLSNATGLKKFLPDDIETLLKVLFAYRNKMFHCGFEWPLKERKNFWERIQKDKWPKNWLKSATTNGEPWVIYLSDHFIQHCVHSIEQTIKGVSHYIYDISGLASERELFESKELDNHKKS